MKPVSPHFKRKTLWHLTGVHQVNLTNLDDFLSFIRKWVVEPKSFKGKFSLVTDQVYIENLTRADRKFSIGISTEFLHRKLSNLFQQSTVSGDVLDALQSLLTTPSYPKGLQLLLDEED
jgi:hypothetical protein